MPTEQFPRNLLRGLGWLVIAVLGYLLLDAMPHLGVTEYTQRKLGALFTIAAVVFGAYRVSRDVFKVDPGQFSSNPVAYAILQFGRMLLAGLFAIAANVSV